MSYSNSNAPRRTAPVIQRPAAAPRDASSPAPPPAYAQAPLGGAMGNAFAGMGYSTAHYNPAFMMPYQQPQPYYYPQQLPPAQPQPYPYAYQASYAQPAPPYSQPTHTPDGYGPLQGQGAAYRAPSSQSAAAAGPSQHSVPRPLHQPHGLPARPAPFSPSTHPLPQKRPRPLDAPAATASGSNSAAPLSYDHASLHPTATSAHAGAPRTTRNPRVAGGARNGPEVVKCCKDDCTFSGPRRAVREHEEDRHLIFAPGREPKPWSGSLKPIDGSVIEGTGISLDTPEALARWIEERKKRWPSKKVVEEKEKARAERIAAGLEAPPRERGGRGRGRGRGGGSDFGTRGRGRGRGGSFGSGSVGDQGYDRAPGVDSTEAQNGEPAAKRTKRTDDGGDAADGAHLSGSDNDDNDDDDDDDDGAPEEMAAKPAPVGPGPSAPSSRDGEAITTSTDRPPRLGEDAPPRPTGLIDDVEAHGPALATSAAGEGAGGPSAQKRFQVVCRHWRKGNCALGDDECPYLHYLPPNAGPPPPPARRRPAPAPAPHNPFARPAGFTDPFSLVEERDHRHVVADVLQVIEFLGANDWLQGVEIRRGQVDEESGIEVLPTAAAGMVGEHQEGKVVVLEDGQQEVAAAAIGKVSATDDMPNKTVEVSSAQTQAASVADHPPAPLAPVDAASASGTGGGMGLFADYGSDSDDEDDAAVEQAVASALLPSA
ncbi:hypothetical protein JCM3774_000241 [Rhodotorula dairenensis]